jgi:dihydrofolate reductase
MAGELIAVAAMSLNRVIGCDNKSPGICRRISSGSKRLTIGHFVLMGERPFESLGKPLPNRTNIVVTRRPRRLARDAKFAPSFVGNWRPRLGRPYQLAFDRLTDRDVWLVRNVDKLVAAYQRIRPERELFVIGGAEIYRRLLPRCSELFLTQVFREVEGDAEFPPFEEDFELVDVPLRTAEFEVRHFKRRQAR